MAAASNLYYGTGRRKTATARVYLQRGTGKITVNNLSLEGYFGGLRSARCRVVKPLEEVDMRNKMDVTIFVRGSGLNGQAGAISHGIARALVEYDESGMVAPVVVDVKGEGSAAAPTGPLSMRRILRRKKLLTRDSRMVERKKVGHRKARKVEQYSKR